MKESATFEDFLKNPSKERAPVRDRGSLDESISHKDIGGFGGGHSNVKDDDVGGFSDVKEDDVGGFDDNGGKRGGGQ